MKQTGQYAIITAFTPNFSDDFRIFLDSVRRITKVPIVVIPLDHSEDEIKELEELEQLNGYVLQLEEEELEPLRHIGNDTSTFHRWAQWFKPLFIQKAIEHHDLTTVLWLDVDLVVLDDLQPLFAQALESFFVMNDYFAPKDCKNDERLYDEYPTPLAEDHEDVVLNSGVIGIHWPRDKPIIDDWIKKTWTIANNPHLFDYISLYDQGVLLWSMRDTGILDKILPKPEWNHKAVRNCYESDKINIQWPTKISSMGGDIIDEIKFDNPDATIAHFAGLPKLSQLCEINNRQSYQYRINKHRMSPITRVFGVGIERAGTHTLAEVFRRANRTETWVRHEFEPALSHEALMKWRGYAYNSDDFRHRLKIYNRNDVQFVSEVNHRLSFLVPEVTAAVPHAKFILLLRSPIALLRSRLLSFACWSEELHKYPGCYQFDVYNLHKQFSSGSAQQNRYRLRAEDPQNLSPIEMHVWDVVETLRFVLRDLRKLSSKKYKILWLEDLADSRKQFDQLIPNSLFWDEATKWLKVHFGARLSCSDETEQWVNEYINEHAGFIIGSIMEVLKEFGVPLQQVRT